MTDAVHISGLHHVSLLVSDLDRSAEFYCRLLGLEADPMRPQMSFAGMWLQLGAQQIHLLALDCNNHGTADPHPGRDAHVALHVNDLDVLARQLEQAEVEYNMSRSGRRALFCRDPDGNGLEFIEIPGG